MQNGKSDRKRTCTRVLSSCLLLFPAALGLPAGEKASPSAASASPPQQVVTLREIPVWEIHECVRDSFLDGLPSAVSPQADPGVRYPALKSGRPVYGEIRSSYLSATRLANAGTRAGGLACVVDPSAGPSGGDLLYVDENADGDLRNDTPRKPLPKAPAGLPTSQNPMITWTWFESVNVTLDAPQAGRRTIELLPCIWKHGDRIIFVRFLPARAYTGRFEAGGSFYDAVLGYRYTLRDPLHDPTSPLCLVAQDGRRVSSPNAEQLNVMTLLGGRYYRFSCTPAVDRLIVRPYDGPLGTLELGAGGRDTQKLQMAGALCAPDFIVTTGAPFDGRSVFQGVRRCEIPVGDYCAGYLTVEMDQVRFSISTNPYPDASGRTHIGKDLIRGIAVRADQPFVLDFSHRPIVMFNRPAGNDPVARGSAVRIEAILVEPVHNTVMRALADLTRRETKLYTTPEGKEGAYEQAPALPPRVTIARADGEVVAQGIMPFG
ncbi:MAG: hypothetical protein MUC88_01460 [Planctomycetes bacterium]|nr:hypothetical protein [Planctomycetota bacterium]